MVVPETEMRSEENERRAASVSNVGPDASESERRGLPSSSPQKLKPSTARLSRWRRASARDDNPRFPRTSSIEKNGGPGPTSVGSLPTCRPRMTNSPSGSEIWNPLAATGRSSAEESRPVATARSLSWLIAPATQTAATMEPNSKITQPARKSRVRRNRRGGAASTFMSLCPHAGYGTAQGSSSASLSVTSPRAKLPLSRTSPSASMTQ